MNKKLFKNKGFTLIELLAVIVILAVIALIAVPIILNVIDDTRRSAAEDSTYGYIKGIEHETAMSQLKNIEYEDKEDYVYNEIPTNIKGMKPTGGIYSLENGIVTNGVFCVDGYVINYKNSIAKVTKKGCTEEDIKIPRTLKISSNTGTYIYPNSGTFGVEDEGKGGELRCETSNENIATCSISGKTVTVTPGTTEGNATITVISASTEKYQEASVAHEAITKPGTLTSYTVTEYEGTYDGEAHGITITNSDKSLRISYGTEEGEYELTESPTYINAGTYTVYYQIEKTGYETIYGSKEVIINKAPGEITLESTSGEVQYDGTIKIGITGNKSGGTLSCTSSDTNVATCKIENNKLEIKGEKAEKTATITVISEGTDNYESAEIQYKINVTKANNTLTLSSNNGNYTYPDSGEVEITENKSKGTLTCTSSDTSVATCKIEDNKLKVTPGTKEGQATITVKSASTTNYNEGTLAYVVNTAKGTLNSYTVNGYSGVYDGSEHGITVESSGATIKYGTSSGSYTLETSPKYSDVGTYTVYYKIEKAGYNTIKGSEKVEITKAKGSVTAPTAKELTYTGSSQELINKGSTTTGTIEYKIEGGTYSTSIPKATNAGTYKVYYRVVGDGNHEDVEETSITVEIKKATLNYTAKGYSGVYDGESHGITVTSEGATIKYGTSSGSYTLTTSPKYTDVKQEEPYYYTVYYQITREGYNTVSGSKTITISKANNTLMLSANTGTYTYPTSGKFEVTENTSGGTLSCTSGNTSVATCSISGTTVTVTPGTTSGNATLTIKSAATTNYKEATVAHEATTALGTLSVTANGYSGTYDGKAHGITVTSSGATIKYGTASGTYNLTSSPTLTNAGTKTVYYQVSKVGYKTVTGSKTVTINKAAGSATLSSSSGTIYIGNSTTFTVSNATGSISGCTSSNTSIATCSVSGTTVTVKGVAAGSATITVNVAAGTNYNSTSKTYSITVNKKILSNVVKLGDYISMTPTSTSYSITKDLTGFSSIQTINPSELNLWRVIKINSDGTIEMVSEYVSSTSVSFIGESGYRLFVRSLNKIASQYTNSKYVIGTRHMGYNGQTLVIETSTLSSSSCGSASTSGNTLESKGCGDTLYTADTDLVKNALGTLVTKNPSGTESIYWLASRYYLYDNSNYWGYLGRFVDSSGNIYGNVLYYYDYGLYDGSRSLKIRPILTLKSGLTVTGSGTSGSPYKLD